MIRTGSLLLLVVFSSGCTVLRKEIGRPLEISGQFEEGVAHCHEVLDALGPPTRLSAMSDGYAFLYEAIEIRERQIGIGGQAGWFQLIKLAVADSDLQRDCLILHFNGEGILISQSRINTLEQLGSAGAIQPALPIQQVVDTDAYEDDAFVAMYWGRSMLSPLTRTLNACQSLNSGMSGIEQSGTSTIVGQHALEMR